MKPGLTLLSYMKPKNEQQRNVFARLKTILKNNDIKFKTKRREYLCEKDFKNVDLVLTLGGDGTFLRTAHTLMKQIPMLGINMDPNNKEGFLLQSDMRRFEKDIQNIINNRVRKIKLTRLKASINKKPLDYFALNEFYIGYEKAYHTARYTLEINGRREFQKSSGLLIGTPAGSHGWIKSAGGKPMELDSRNFQVVVREVYCSTLTECTFKRFVQKPNQKVKVISEMKNGIVVADSLPREFRINKGDILEIEDAKNPVDYIMTQR